MLMRVTRTLCYFQPQPKGNAAVTLRSRSDGDGPNEQPPTSTGFADIVSEPCTCLNSRRRVKTAADELKRSSGFPRDAPSRFRFLNAE
jgi:hypothetical protein